MCDQPKKPYVSVIKINGVPILPPLITPELRKELSGYKHQAVRLEQRLKTFRELKHNLNDLINKTETPLPKCDKTACNLTKDLIEVTQYNGSGVQTICSNVQLSDSPKYQTWTRPGRCKSESRKTDNGLTSEESTTPRLIRSNSYTLENPSPVLLQHMKNQASKSPTIEVYQTDISVQQITLNTAKSDSFFTKNPFDVMEDDSELMKVLKDIPEEYSQQVIELLKKQHLEQKNRLERYDSIKQSEDLIDLSESDAKLRRSSTFSVSPSQSLYYSIHSDSDTITPHPDIEKNGVVHPKNVSRELFQDLDPITIKETKKNKAASVIGAYTRGYLTRRLMKTDKVQYLIATVKDVLLCALELHHSESIDEKDVELHRRLINQLSAALYSFHDIFFELSVRDQMAIISADRQRKLEKLKKPQSGRKSSRPTSGNIALGDM